MLLVLGVLLLLLFLTFKISLHYLRSNAFGSSNYFAQLQRTRKFALFSLSLKNQKLVCSRTAAFQGAQLCFEVNPSVEFSRSPFRPPGKPCSHQNGAAQAWGNAPPEDVATEPGSTNLNIPINTGTLTKGYKRQKNTAYESFSGASHSTPAWAMMQQFRLGVQGSASYYLHVVLSFDKGSPCSPCLPMTCKTNHQQTSPSPKLFPARILARKAHAFPCSCCYWWLLKKCTLAWRKYCPNWRIVQKKQIWPSQVLNCYSNISVGVFDCLV